VEPKEKIKVVLVDDHTLFRKGMVELINNFPDFEVVWDVCNGSEFVNEIRTKTYPDLVLLDIAMPVMDGFGTGQWIKKKFPDLKFIVLSMSDNEGEIIRMIKIGARGYILKDADPAYLERALRDIVAKGFYYSEWLSGTLINNIRGLDAKKEEDVLSEKELEFLKLACTEMTYKEIADKMNLSARTIDGYRDAIFEKLSLKSRVGIVLYAIKHGIVKV
jgi:two-component system, NarL family, invasion response regulator UvrY